MSQSGPFFGESLGCKICWFGFTSRFWWRGSYSTSWSRHTGLRWQFARWGYIVYLLQSSIGTYQIREGYASAGFQKRKPRKMPWRCFYHLHALISLNRIWEWPWLRPMCMTIKLFCLVCSIAGCRWTIQNFLALGDQIWGNIARKKPAWPIRSMTKPHKGNSMNNCWRRLPWGQCSSIPQQPSRTSPCQVRLANTRCTGGARQYLRRERALYPWRGSYECIWLYHTDLNALDVSSSATAHPPPSSNATLLQPPPGFLNQNHPGPWLLFTSKTLHQYSKWKIQESVLWRKKLLQSSTDTKNVSQSAQIRYFFASYSVWDPLHRIKAQYPALRQ